MFGLLGLAHMVFILCHVTGPVFMGVYICNLSRFCVFNKYFYLRWAVSIDFRLLCVYISAHLFVLLGDSLPVIRFIDGIISNLSVY